MSEILSIHDTTPAESTPTSASARRQRPFPAVTRSWLLALGLFSATAGCQQATEMWNSVSDDSSSQTAERTEPEAMPVAVRDKAAMCGRSLGVGVRCNLLRSEGDFAIARHLALDGLRSQSGPGDNMTEIETAFDLGTLEMINTVGTCQATPTELAALEQQIVVQLATCKAQ